jgi:hypothetical protein
MLGTGFGYAAAIVMLVLAIGGIWEYFFVKKGGSRRRIITLVVFLVASIIVLINQYLTNKQHDKDVGQISGLTIAVQTANTTQQTNAKEFASAQEAARKEFLSQFNSLSDKVAKLQTEAATESLQKQVTELQVELQATQKAVAPGPKPRLIFSLAGYDKHIKQVIDRATLPAVNNVVHVELDVANPTDVNADQGEIIITICNLCKYATEPVGFKKAPKGPDIERIREFGAFYARSTVSDTAIEVAIPASVGTFQIGMQYRCKNCEDMSAQIVTVDVARK